MEFGSCAQLQCGGNIIGVSWTTPSHAPMADATQLITTSNTRVQIHAADDQRVIASWITRPGSANRFVVAAVQHRSSRQLFAVQDGSRLLTWNERQASLDAAVTTLVRKEVYALRVSKHASAVFVIYRDGGVSVYSLKLEELFYAPGVDAPPPTGQAKGKGKGKAQEAAEAVQPIATWARLTSIPTEPGKLILLVAVQQTGAAASAPGSTLLRLFTASPSKQQAGVLPVTFEHRATHSLSAPAGSPPGCRAASLTLHKHFHALTVLWSTGTMQVWRFQKAPNVSAGVQWYMAHPQAVMSRELGTQAPGSPTSGSGSSPASLRVASFALEPSCLVLAGAGAAATGQEAVYMTVWDVRYGVILGTKEVAMHAEESEQAASSSTRGPVKGAGGGKRMRSSSTGSIGSATGSLPKTAAVVAGSDLTPADIFQVSVNEDGSYVACVSRSSVLVTPVAVRGASLASALGRLPGTVAALHAEQAGTTASQHRCAVMDLDALVSGSSTSASGDGVLTAASRDRWAQAVQAGSEQVQRDKEAVKSTQQTPTVASIAAVLSRYGVHVPGSDSGLVGSGAALAGGKGDNKKRARPAEEEGRAEGVAQGLPYELALACMQRVSSELQSQPAGEGMLIAAPLLTALTAHKAASLAACPALVPALLQIAAMEPVQAGDEEEDRPVAHPSSVTALVLLAELLLACVDVPESSLVAILQASLHRVSKQTLAGLWAKVTAAAQKAAGVNATPSLPHHVNPSILGLLYLTSLVVRAPRNDVFMEGALAALEREDVKTLFACLLRLLHMHSNAFVHVRPVLSAESLEALIGMPKGGSKGKAGKAASEGGAGEEQDGLMAGIPRTALTMAPRPGFAHGKTTVPPLPGSASVQSGQLASTAQANPLAAHLPSHGQVLDWLRMTLDAHFTRVVLMAKADRDTEGSKKSVTMYALLLEVSRVVQADVGLAHSAAPVRGHVEHLLQRQALPVEQERDYSAAIIRV